MTGPLDVLRRSWILYRANGQLIVGYAAWLLLTAAAFVLTGFVGNEPTRQSALFLVQLADLILWLWVGVLVTRVTAAAASPGKRLDAAALPAESWSLVWPFAWATVLQILVTLGGFLLFVVPGFVFVVWFAFAQQAAVIDGKRGIDALAESRALCRGRFFTVAWHLFLGPFLVALLYFAVILLVWSVIAAITNTPAEALFGDRPPLWMDAIASVGEVFLMPLLYVYWTLAYLELKVRR
jgi:hypothetical protein